MNDEHKEKIYYIQQQADELSVEISKLMLSINYSFV